MSKKDSLIALTFAWAAFLVASTRRNVCGKLWCGGQHTGHPVKMKFNFADFLISFLVEILTIFSFFYFTENVQNFQLETHGLMFCLIWLLYKIFNVCVLFLQHHGGPYLQPSLQPILGMFIAKEFILICIEIGGILLVMIGIHVYNPGSIRYSERFTLLFGGWLIYKIVSLVSFFFGMILRRGSDTRIEEQSHKTPLNPAVDVI